MIKSQVIAHHRQADISLGIVICYWSNTCGQTGVQSSIPVQIGSSCEQDRTEKTVPHRGQAG